MKLTRMTALHVSEHDDYNFPRRRLHLELPHLAPLHELRLNFWVGKVYPRFNYSDDAREKFLTFILEMLKLLSFKFACGLPVFKASTTHTFRVRRLWIISMIADFPICTEPHNSCSDSWFVLLTAMAERSLDRVI